MSKRKSELFVLQHVNGDSWFERWTAIGPAFTTDRSKAAVLSRYELIELPRHWALALYDSVPAKKSPTRKRTKRDA